MVDRQLWAAPKGSSIGVTESEKTPVDRSVAVIVTCYNQERYIEQALDSLLAQTVMPEQVIVIDGHSSDRSVTVIEDWMTEHPEFPITFIAHDKNYGLNATLNQGMEYVTSQFVMTLYGDDWLEPDRIAVQAPLLSATNDDVCMVIGSMREVDSRGNVILDHDFGTRVTPLAKATAEERLSLLITQNVIPSPAVLLKTDAVRKIGGYDTSLTFDDYDLWLRLLSQFSLIFDSRIVVNYRILGNSLSRNVDRHGDFLLSEARMVHKHLGKSTELDEIIKSRLLGNAQALLALRDEFRLDIALQLLLEAGKDTRVMNALSVLAQPGGIDQLMRNGLIENDAVEP